MLNLKLIGIGAAGNKGAIQVLNDGVLKKEDVLLINSVEKDIPAEYRDGAFIYNAIGGCGKEASMGKALALKALADDKLADVIDNLITEDTDAVIIVSSAEGGTGCGGAPIIAKFCNDTIGIPTICIPFTGFEEDARGLQNTIEYFQNMNDEYVVQAISNKKFLKNNNYNKAAEDANKELSNRIKMMQGRDLKDSLQNIDRTDLYKSVTTPGFTMMNKVSLSDVKTAEQFNDALLALIDTEKSVDIDTNNSKIQVLAVMINIDKSKEDIIDQSFTVLKERLGEPYEIFRHIQYDDTQEEYVSFMAQGLGMPTKEIKKVYERYLEKTSHVDKNKDSFFDQIKELKGDEEGNQFNIGSMRRRKKRVSTDDFLNQYRKKDDNDDIISKNY